MSDGERAGLLADAETPQTTKHNSRWIAKRWRVFAALGAGACLLAMGVATRAARSNEAALGANEDQVKRETIDARLKSVFGISLEDFAALVRDENDVQIAGKELYEKKKQYKRLQQMERAWEKTEAAALAKAREERELDAASAPLSTPQSDLISDSEPVEALVESETPVELESSNKTADAVGEREAPAEESSDGAADSIAVLKHTLEVPVKVLAREDKRHARRKLRRGVEAQLGAIEEYDDDEEIAEESSAILPVYFHTEKSGGTSLVLHTLELMNSDNDDVLGLINRVRSEDVMLDKDLRAKHALCPGSAMFLTTVWKAGTVWEPGHPRPLEDSTQENWEQCRLLSSHTGRELLRRTTELEAELGLSRPKILMGMFRDPAEYEQAAWRSELFMYHDLRAKLGWGKLAQTPLGSALTQEELKDFGADSKFAKIMLEDHCKAGLDKNFQTKKLLEDKWTSMKDNHDAIMALAKERVMELDWVGLTHRFDESACVLAYTLRRQPLSTSDSNYDRGSLLPATLRANHPHSGDHSEGAMDPGLKAKLYECNDLDAAVFKLAETRFEAKKTEMMETLQRAISASEQLRPIRGGGAHQMLDPKPYIDCMHQAGMGAA
jgi:hypothetical protein